MVFEGRGKGGVDQMVFEGRGKGGDAQVVMEPLERKLGRRSYLVMINILTDTPAI
jgi:hypothetical protein